MNRKLASAVPVFLLFLVIIIPGARAEWDRDGVAVCSAAGTQCSSQIISDGAGGAILTWSDSRNQSDSDIYAQRLDAAGNPLWTADGVAISSGPGYQQYPTIVSDGAGGAIVLWSDSRNATSSWDIYAQRIDGAGNTLWTLNGVGVCTAQEIQLYPEAVSDGAGGAIIVWEDDRNGTDFDVYAQRIDADGVSLWTDAGVPVCTVPLDQTLALPVSDGFGGVIIVWKDFRGGVDQDIYAQRLDSSGRLLWADDGAGVCTAAGDQEYPRMATDGLGGAFVTWHDYRNGTPGDIYVQRVDASGQTQWGSNGWEIGTSPVYQNYPAIAADGVNGAIIAWNDDRNADRDIYAQRVDIWGNSLWASNGIPVDTAEGQEYAVSIAPDGEEGAVISWAMYPDGGFTNIYAQRIDGSGNRLWDSSAMPLTLAPNNQYNTAIISIIPDGDDGFIAHWQDSRPIVGDDIFAQRIGPHGHWGYAAPEVSSLRDVPGDQGGWVNLSWDASRLDWGTEHLITRYTIWRALPPASSTAHLPEGSAVAGRTPVLNEDVMIIADPSMAPVEPKRSVVWLQQTGSDPYYWELVSSVDAYYRERYAKVVPTVFDSTSTSTEVHYFQVLAHTADPLVFWESAVDSCRSVDNVAPSTPNALTGTMLTSPLGLSLSWDPNVESDLSGYAVYRGNSGEFIPGPGNLLAAPGNTSLFDPEWTPSSGYYYKVSARDIHENESDFALLSPDETSPVGNPVPSHRNALYQSVPNPFNPCTRVIFEIAREGRVDLRVYDTAGCLVRTLLNETMATGRHEARWDGRDGQGRVAASGTYFVQLRTADFTQSRKVLLSK